MKIRLAIPAALTCGLLLAGCGYLGDPQYPAINVVARVQDLIVVERGPHLAVSFTIPALTTEGLAVKSIGSIDLRVGANKDSEFRTESWAESADRIEVPAPTAPGVVQTNIPVSKYVGQDVIAAVRIKNARGRPSEWSNLVTVHAAPPLATPSDFTRTAVAEGVLLKWNAPGIPSFRLFRRSETELGPAPLATSDKSEYLDTTTVYGKRYEYWVQGVDGANETDVIGSEPITPVDTFPPAVPAGLTAIPGLNAIELAWERNTETDFKAYRIFRAAAGGPFELIADSVEAPNYSDAHIESGHRYRYAITAVDQLGNESEKCAPAEAQAP